MEIHTTEIVNGVLIINNWYTQEEWDDPEICLWNMTRRGKDHMTRSRSGELHPMYDKHHSEETKRKMSGPRPQTSGDGHPMWNKRHSEETRLKMSGPRPGMEREGNPFWNKKHTQETKRQIKDTLNDSSYEHQLRDDRYNMWLDQNMTCPICNEPLLEGQIFNIDHIIPREHWDLVMDNLPDGIYYEDMDHRHNLQLVHKFCNESKRDKIPSNIYRMLPVSIQLKVNLLKTSAQGDFQ